MVLAFSFQLDAVRPTIKLPQTKYKQKTNASKGLMGQSIGNIKQQIVKE